VGDRIGKHGGSRAVIVAFLFSVYDLIMACVSKLYASIASYFAAASAGAAVGISSGGNGLTDATSNETTRQAEQRHACVELDPSLSRQAN
jgi:hypothetical protein